MTDDHDSPPRLDLDRLFRDRSVFDSSDDMRDAGFTVIRESKHEKVVVAGHRSAPGFLFKKFLRDVSLSHKEQLAVYETRVNGARALRAHLEALQIQRVVVPRKWICALPARFRAGKKPEHIVVVDRFDILGREESERCYRRMGEDQLRDLCTVFFAFRRVDFTAKNMPFTPDGRIAFIDTGYLTPITKKLRSRKKSYDKNTAKLFTPKHRRFAAKIWDELVNRFSNT